MRTAQVFTHYRCNQNCTYCTVRRSSDDRVFIQRTAVEHRIDLAFAAGAVEIVITGGEPTLRRDLAGLVAYARAAGAERVVLETNATLIDGPMAAELRAAGLTLARINLAGPDDTLDAVTRDPGGFRRTLAGARALTAAGVPLEIAAAIVASTRPGLDRLPEALSRWFGAGAVRSIVLSVPVETSEPSEWVAYADAIETISGVDAAARRAAIAVRLAPDASPPPCLFPARSRLEHLFSLTRGGGPRPGFSRIEACGACSIAESCPGISQVYLDRDPPSALRARPIQEDRVRRRLSLASTVEDQVRRELVSLNREPGSKEPAEHIIRINFHCNQACRFCFVSTHLPSAGHDAVEEAIREAGRRGLHIVLSGGEPTLNARLVDYVRLAKSVSSKPVELQTNAVRLDDETLVQALVDAGLDQVFVSLHGSTAAISDRVTEARGTFARTVIGVDHLTRAGVFVVLNFVICSANHEDLVPYVRWVAGRWPRATVNFSFVAASTDVVPRDKHLIPRYSDVLPHLAEALRLAKDLDLATAGFESMCGLPLCIVPADLAPYFQLELIPDGFDGGEFSYPPSCQECDLRGRCYGLRRGYEALHGSDELSAVRREPTRA